MMSDLLDVALRYQRAGLSVLPIRADGSKAPALSGWKELQSRLPTEEELRQWFGGALRGVGVVAGAVSGNLAVIDFDDDSAWFAFMDACNEYGYTGWTYDLPCAKTPCGHHLYFRAPEPLPTQVLARAEDGSTLVELRGEGAYAIVPPSPAEVHPDGKPYQMIRGSLENVPTLAAEQVEDLLAVARELNRKQEPAPLRVSGDAQRVGDLYNQKADVLSLLQQHGWAIVGRRGANIYLRRPGKTRGVSATFHEQLRTFFCFSCNAMPFESGRAYSPFAVYALLEHNADFAKAAHRLGEEFGVQPKRNGKEADSPVVPQPAPRRAISLRELMQQQFAPLTYLVPDVLPEGGLTLLVGRPKVGKSWFALQVACALSAGGFALGLDTPLPKRSVLYCALEDGLRRLQRRIQLLATGYDPDAFHVVTELSPLDRGGLEELRELIRSTQAQVVFVDVVARILPRRRRNDGVYQSDYDAFALLKDLAVAEGVSIVAVHHESKAPNEDPLMRVSGSTGLTGAVDAVLTLSKPRGEQMGTLFVTGRDVEKEGEYAISFTAGKWYLEGDAREVQMTEQQRRIMEALRELGEASPKEIADYCGVPHGNVKVMLRRMTEKGLVHAERGKYKTPVTAVTAVTLSPTQDGANTTPPVTAVTLLPKEDGNTVTTVTPVTTVTTVTRYQQERGDDEFSFGG